MIRNRYDGVLQRYHAQIGAVGGQPSGALWHVAALALFAKLPPETCVLELGCGAGDSALPILQHTNLSLRLVDASWQMIDMARKNLRRYKGRIDFSCRDALDFVRSSDVGYRSIYASHVVHNFSACERETLFKAIHATLVPDGVFVLDDVIPRNDSTDAELLERQLKRYALLPRDVADAIIEHVTEDSRPPYRMGEPDIVSALLRAGFKDVAVVDRIEREALVFAKK